jgi:hypothetical protein
VQRIAVWNAVGQHNGTPYVRFEISDPRPQAQGTAAPAPLADIPDDLPF